MGWHQLEGVQCGDAWIPSSGGAGGYRERGSAHSDSLQVQDEGNSMTAGTEGTILVKMKESYTL